MSLFGFFRPTQKKSAETAKERLQILLAHERSNRTGPDYLPLMQKEIIAVIMKYVEIDEDKVRVQLDRNADSSILEVDIELPGPPAKPRARMAG